MDTKELPKTLALLTVGFAAGVVAGILFAPNIDPETTDNIKRKAGEIGDELESKYRSEIEHLKDKIAALKGDVETVVENSSK